MHPDLERLIRLQNLDTSAEVARRRIDEMPARIEALAAAVTGRAEAVTLAQHRLAESQAARRTLEKDLSLVQGRLSRFKDQLMQVKTNREYQAMQHEIVTADQEVRTLEERVLERMIEGDDLAAALRRAEAALADEERAAEASRVDLERERMALERELAGTATARSTLVGQISPEALRLYDHITRGRRGVAVTEARDGHCATCHVRLRPQVFNDVRRNESIIQCESCQRILYFLPPLVAAASDQP
jgi:uncharacterized protein